MYFEDATDFIYPESPAKSEFFSISFQPIKSEFPIGNSGRDIYDPDKVRDTVIRACELLIKKLSDRDVGIVFICDDEKGKEKARLRLFSIWFEFYKEQLGSIPFHYYSKTREYSESSFCCGILIPKSSTNYESRLQDVKAAIKTNLGLDQG